MSVPVQTPSKEYIANGTTTAFPLEFNCDKAEYLIVTLNGEEAPVGSWTLANDTVTFNVAPLNGVVVNLERNTPFQRTTNYQLYDNSFRPSAVNKDFDLIWWKLQELGYRDQVIWLALVKEISDRIAGDDNLQNQINTIDEWLDNLQQTVNENTNDIAQLVTDLSKEIADRITNDEALKEMFLAMMDEAINEGTINALAITHVECIADLINITNVWDGRTIYVKDIGMFEYDALRSDWIALDKDIVRTVESIADLIGLEKWDGRAVRTKGYHKATNFALAQPYQGGSLYIYVSSRSSENDGFLCINGWVLQIENNEVAPEQAGAKGDGSDDYIPLQKVLSIRTPVVLSDTTYCTSKPLWHDSGKVIKGTGYQKTVIEKTTNSTESGLPTVTAFGKTIVQAVDAVLIARTWNQSYNQYSNIDGFLLKHSDSLGSIGYGYYAPMFAEAQVQNVRTANCDIGIYSLDAWMVAWTRVTASANRPYVILGGTSNGFHECWATNAKGVSSYAYQFENLYYSHMLSCGADFCGTDGNPIKALFRIVNSNITITSCASEYTHAYKFAHLQGAVVSFKQFQAMHFYNKYKIENPVWGNVNALFDARSQTRLEVEGCTWGWENKDKTTSPSFIDITDTSFLKYIEYSNALTIDSVGLNLPVSNLFKISYGGGKTNVYVDLGNYVLDTSISNNESYAGTIPANSGLISPPTHKKIENKAVLFNSLFQAKPLSLSTENISNLRGLGAVFLTQGSNTNGTPANGYPSTGGWAVFQISDTSSNNASNNSFQLAAQTDGKNIGFRCAPYGGVYTQWYSIFHSGNDLVALTTATNNIGSSSITYKDCFLQNAVTVVSDENYKTDIQELSEAEIKCAIDCGKLYRRYKLKTAIVEKGEDDARYHIGTIAQKVIQCFTDNGLDWTKYGIITYEKWSAVEAVEAVYSEDGELVSAAIDGREAGEVYMVRYDEFNSFVMAGQQARIDALEAI